jgi:hypothetical protein
VLGLELDPKWLHQVDRLQETRTGPDRCTDKGALTRIATFSDKSTTIVQDMQDKYSRWQGTEFTTVHNSPGDLVFVQYFVYPSLAVRK